MISIDKAKRLKELRLEWNPKRGDWHKADYWPTPVLFVIDTLRLDNIEIEQVIENIKNRDDEVWLPRLDQLLDEIEKIGYWWLFSKDYCVIGKGNNVGDNVPGQRFNVINDNKEDAVADALIWIMFNK